MRRPPNLTRINTPSERAPTPQSYQRGPNDYLELYGLAKPPFSRADNNDFILFRSRKRGFEQLIAHMVNGSGLMLLQGGEGIGKTETLLSAAAVRGDSDLPVIMVSRPPDGTINLAQLLSALSGDGDDATIVAPPIARTDDAAEEPDEATTQQTINERAIERFLSPPRKTLLADDIDLMPPDCVRLVRSLAQRIPDAPGAPAVVLTTSTDLADITKRPDLSSIATLARKTIRLLPLKSAEVDQYIERSLWVSGGTSRRLIAPDAMKLLITRSGGVPGAINQLMETALTAGFARGDPTISAKTIGGATAPYASRRPIRPLPRPGVGSLVIQIVSAGLLIAGASVFFYKAFQGAPETPKTEVPAASVAQPPASIAAAPAAPQPPQVTKPAEAVPAALVAALMKRGDQSLELGDIAAARLLYQRAAEAGNAAAALALGKTYDPNYVTSGKKPDSARAADWYRKAASLGDPRAADLLKQLSGQ